DHAAFAASLGLLALNVDKPDESGPAWDRALAVARPTALGVRCDPRVIRRHAAAHWGSRPRKATSRSPGLAWAGTATGVANRPGRSASVTSNGASRSSSSASCGGIGRGCPHACATSQPCTAISTAPTLVTMLVDTGQPPTDT